jgi:predicted nucleotidyltransferase
MISQEQIQIVLQRIVDGYHPKKVILFGSLAQGNATVGSDIDLLVIKDETLPPVQRNRQVRKLLKDLPFPVDVIVKNSQEFEQLRDVIGTVASTANKYGRVLYG